MTNSALLHPYVSHLVLAADIGRAGRTPSQHSDVQCEQHKSQQQQQLRRQPHHPLDASSFQCPFARAGCTPVLRVQGGRLGGGAAASTATTTTAAAAAALGSHCGTGRNKAPGKASGEGGGE